MSTPLVILCPGQGAQAVGMGKAYYEKSAEARAAFEQADKVLASFIGSSLGSELSRLCFEGPADRLNQTDASQPAIFATSIACYATLKAAWGYSDGEAPLAATSGLSLGEYTALTIAGAMSCEDGLKLVALRGRAMQDAAEASHGGMVALIGADETQAQEVCEAARGQDVLVCANFNAPGQIVLSGSKSACDRAVEVAARMGLRATPLTVAGAFHSPLMRPAADRLADALARTEIKAPKCAVYANVTGDVHDDEPETIRVRLVEQLTSPVRWSQSCTAKAATYAGKADFHELAPGRTLAGLYRRISKDVKVKTNDEPV
ncbi:MAG: ACP S-malonyltransferase [Planctomycetes bacterium]|nr:ACP S-malonyltransferase [Planctomycetota bacterium]